MNPPKHPSLGGGFVSSAVGAMGGRPLVFRKPVRQRKRLSGGATLLNRDIAAGSPGLSAFCAHSGFSFCSNPEANTADHHTDTGRRAFLNNPTSFRRRFLNDVVVGKCGRYEESCEGGTGQNCAQSRISRSF